MVRLSHPTGVWPGSPGEGTTTTISDNAISNNSDTAEAVARAAHFALTESYLNAARRVSTRVTGADLGNVTLISGVYSAPGKSALVLSGPLVLDGDGDPDAVFIFQTDSTLQSASGSSVTLIGRAQACNVFWQVGSSAALGLESTFVGNIMAASSITVHSGVTIHGRALALGGSVTMHDATVTDATCASDTALVTSHNTAVRIQ